jgi:hypothetical protein
MKYKGMQSNEFTKPEVKSAMIIMFLNDTKELMACTLSKHMLEIEV